MPFFGRDAMTTTTFAAMALRFGCPVLPARLERTWGAHFRLTVHAPILSIAEPDFDTAVTAIVRRVTAMLEEWIRDRADQCFGSIGAGRIDRSRPAGGARCQGAVVGVSAS